MALAGKLTVGLALYIICYFISTHSFLVCLLVCMCVYGTLTVFVLIWAKLPDINKMDGWMDMRHRLSYIAYPPTGSMA